MDEYFESCRVETNSGPAFPEAEQHNIAKIREYFTCDLSRLRAYLCIEIHNIYDRGQCSKWERPEAESPAARQLLALREGGVAANS